MNSSEVADRESANRTYHEAQSQMELLPNYYRWTYKQFLPFLHGQVIELGCGAGLGIQFYEENATRVYAVDYNQELLDRIDAAFPSGKVQTYRLDLTDDWADLESLEVQAVVMMDILEHFDDDAELMRKVVRCVKPGGHVAIKVPAQADLFSEIDKASGHYRRYDRSQLKQVVEAAGLETVWIRPINPLGAIAYRAKREKKSNFSQTFSPGALKLINIAIPALSLLDHLRFLPGQSWVGVFRKPEV
ncbi:class I SAM-dependent methyltransferase [Denitrobaculum tricleocarpae]|uniref:Class I SAM-dependent methyltransferase n=1 Tax=Denitrobaculum tricleocarpae TaxID=2591009 RepID=A0A545TGD3_9PROT|nr:class I SAM-dependent methyltransferase [Denitrobaculum tricleocarpae]TQV76258.1 class I SAM-dependent methyltransferase [Denitrobaculum tricleocarpae]